jgi:pimeloyl-ACP methyl ester carboxylesterase
MGANDPDFQALAGRNPPVAASIAPLFDSPDIAVLEKMWSDSPFDSLNSLKKIAVPSLVLSSPRDDLHPQEVADAISGVLPNVKSAILPARYHEPESYHLELNKQISQFL